MGNRNSHTTGGGGTGDRIRDKFDKAGRDIDTGLHRHNHDHGFDRDYGRDYGRDIDRGFGRDYDRDYGRDFGRSIDRRFGADYDRVGRDFDRGNYGRGDTYSGGNLGDLNRGLGPNSGYQGKNLDYYKDQGQRYMDDFGRGDLGDYKDRFDSLRNNNDGRSFEDRARGAFDDFKRDGDNPFKNNQGNYNTDNIGDRIRNAF